MRVVTTAAALVVALAVAVLAQSSSVNGASLLVKVRDGDVDKVRRHLAATTADANELDEEGRTALHWLVATAGIAASEDAGRQGSAAGGANSVEEEDPEVVRMQLARLLVDASLNVNLQDRDGQTALHIAAADHDLPSNYAMVEFLVGSRANVNIKNKNGQTPLHVAAAEGSVATTTLLLKSGAQVNAVDDDGQTPLHLAIQARRSDTAEVLLAAGANRNAKNGQQETPMHIAAQLDSDQGILLLLREGASTSIGDTKGRSPLLIAAETGNLASLKALPLAEGLKARDERGWTPLHAASANGHVHVVEYLVAALEGATTRGSIGMFGTASTGLETEDHLGNTPLHLALFGGHVGVSRVLVLHGAKVDARAQFFEATLSHHLTTETTRSLLTLSSVLGHLSTWLPLLLSVLLVFYGGLVYLLFALQRVVGRLAQQAGAVGK